MRRLLAVMACLGFFPALGYAFHFLWMVCFFGVDTYAAREKLETSGEFNRALSQSCVQYLKEHPLKDGIIAANDPELPSTMRALKPPAGWIDSNVIHLYFGERGRGCFALSCRSDGSMWLSGPSSGGTHCIYFDPAKPKPTW